MGEERNRNFGENLSTGESGNTQEQLRKRTTVLSVAVVALAVVLAGTLGYGYLTLHKHGLQLKDLPGVQESLALVSDRVDAVETKLKTWARNFERVNERIDKVERATRYNRELAKTRARKEAEQMGKELEARLDTKLKEKTGVLDARVTLLESAREAERARLAQLRKEVADVQRATGQDLGTLHSQMTRNESELDRLARRLEPRRVDFELREDRTQEIAKGVSLRITGTNVDRQQAEGWLWLMPDRKTLWLRDLGIQQAFRFYHKDGTGPHELVFTRVSDDWVTGYVLLQVHRSEEIGAGASVSQETEGARGGAEEAAAGQ